MNNIWYFVRFYLQWSRCALCNHFKTSELYFERIEMSCVFCIEHLCCCAFSFAVVSPTKSDLSRLHNCITSGCLWNQCFKVGKGHGNANDYGRVENPTIRLPVFWEFIFSHLEKFHGFNFDSTRFKYRYFRSCDANGPTT